MIEDEFWLLVTKYITNEASEEDITRLSLFLKKHEKYQRAFNDVAGQWDFVAEPMGFHIDTSEAKKKMLQRIHEDRNTEDKIIDISRQFYKIAATIVLLLTSYFLVTSYFTAQDWKNLTTASNEKLKIILPDSTQVWLNQNSKVSYNYSNTNERLIKLEGEAYFDVVRNEQRPFIIEAKYFKTQVLGTSFNIESRTAKKASISVVSGKVSVSPLDTKVQLLLERGDGAFFDDVHNNVKKRKLADVDNEIAWVEGRFLFDNSTMESVISYLSSYYHVSFELSDENIKNCLITASFKGESLKSILNVLCTSLNCQYEILDNRRIIITGTGCEKKPGDSASILPAKNQY